jgi:serine/threonine-protein kinase
MAYQPLPLNNEPDGLVWLLGVIALIAVVGLVPLWALVYRAYSADPVVPPTSTPPLLVTQTPAVAQVRVPELVGQKVGEAQRELERLGLDYTVEEQTEPGVDPGVILSQSPAPGQQVPRDTAVTLVVNQSGRELVVPDVVGYPLEMVRSGLESDGLIVVTEEVWAGETEGMVLAQTPEAGAEVRAGEAVTLTISGGVDVPIPLTVNFADLLVLKSAELPQRTFRPGGVIGVTLRWEALRSFDTNYVVFVHLIGPDNRLVAQDDSEPIIPSSRWAPGVEVVDPHQFSIPADAPTGRCRLRVGLYPQGAPASRLSVIDAGLTTVDSNSVLIAEVELQP